MRTSTCACMGILAVCLLVATPASSTDTDGSGDCDVEKIDFGDAPEGVLAYVGVAGHFPTCILAGAAGTMEVAAACPPMSTPPGLTGYVKHVLPVSDPLNYWLGCHSDAAGIAMGIDSETNGKVNTPPVGFSFCDDALATDCVSPAGPFWDQDECFLGGGLDAGLLDPEDLLICHFNTVKFEAHWCSPAAGTHDVYLNILLDMNHDGDWNDNFFCPAPVACAYEWAVKNDVVTLGPGCTPISATFMVGPNPEPGWLRITLTEDPVTDDFPWAGSVGLAGDAFVGGETEDYPRNLVAAVPTTPSTWGRLKVIYR